MLPLPLQHFSTSPTQPPFPFKVLQLIIYKTQEVTLSPGCAHLKRLKTKYGISLCHFLSCCASHNCIVLFFCSELSRREKLGRSAEHIPQIQLFIFQSLMKAKGIVKGLLRTQKSDRRTSLISITICFLLSK